MSTAFSACKRCGGDLRGKDQWEGNHRYFPNCMETIHRQFEAFAVSNQVPPWYKGPLPWDTMAPIEQKQ